MGNYNGLLQTLHLRMSTIHKVQLGTLVAPKCNDCERADAKPIKILQTWAQLIVSILMCFSPMILQCINATMSNSIEMLYKRAVDGDWGAQGGSMDKLPSGARPARRRTGPHSPDCHWGLRWWPRWWLLHAARGCPGPQAFWPTKHRYAANGGQSRIRRTQLRM